MFINLDLVRVYDVRSTRNGNPSGTVALFGGLITFRCTVMNNLAVLGRGIHVFLGKENVTGEFRRRIAYRIMAGGEGAPEAESPLSPLITIRDVRRTSSRSNTVGAGRLAVSCANLGISIPFWVKGPGEGAYRIVLPGYYLSQPARETSETQAPRPKWIDKFRWQAGLHDISSDIKGAALKGWLETLGLTGIPARPPQEWRKCATCRWHVCLGDEGRSTWEMRDKGEVAPRHFCAHPAHTESGEPAPLAIKAVRFANEALAHYGRNARAGSFIWITPHRKGRPVQLQDQAIWEEGCELHTFRGEADWSRLKLVDGKAVIEVVKIGTSHIYELEARFQKSLGIWPRA